MKKFFTHPLILSLILVVILVFFNGQGWLDAPKNAFFRLTRPFQETTYRFTQKINNLAGVFATTAHINRENISLKKESTELLGEIARLKEVIRENEFLRQQLGLPLPKNKKLILANIIGQDLFGLNRYFLIDKGREDGIREKSVVITAGNILVGRVVETLDSFSKVRLISDPDSRVNALIQDSEVTGMVKSNHKLDLVIDLLPQGEAIRENAMVVTSGLTGLFPAGLLIGQIQMVVSSDAQISQTAKIKPAADFANLKKVFVIR